MTQFRKQVLALLGERYSDKTLVLCPTVFVRLLGGDHKAAILLSQILYWGDRTKDRDGWFYKSYSDWQSETGLSESQVRRILNGDKRVKRPQLTLRDLGVETKLRKVKTTGAPTLHFRIDQAHFLSVLQAFIEQVDPVQCAGSTPDIDEDQPSATPGMNTDQSGGTLIPSKTSAPDQQTSDSDHQRDDDLQLFYTFAERFGKFRSEQAGTFRAELERLGADQVLLVLQRCATRGRSWHYVQKALANEKRPEVPAESLTNEHDGDFLPVSGLTTPTTPECACEIPAPVSVRLKGIWQNTGKTVQQVWDSAFQQMEAQLDRQNFVTYVRDLVLVDFQSEDSTFIVAVGTVSARDMLQHRLGRTIQRILSDVAGQSVVVTYILAAEWAGQGERIA